MDESKGRRHKVIGYWMSDKKSQKLNWSEFGKVCRLSGYELVKLDLNRPIEEQGIFSVIIHKLNDIIVKAQSNVPKAIAMISNFENYVNAHPEVVVIDPIENVRKLLDRYQSYRVILDSNLYQIDVFTPTFVELTSCDPEANLKALKKAEVKFPFVCKPSVANGNDCHKMMIVFNKEGLKDCQPPCVAHTIVNHNAVLYKLFIIGDEFHVVKRPSIKNFYPSDSAKTINFHSHDVSKPDSSSVLSVLDSEDNMRSNCVAADPEKLASIVRMLCSELGMSLLGVDVVVENTTKRHFIIDINPYPGYDGFPDFFESLMRCIEERLKESSVLSDDSGFETADSSDEKNRNNNGKIPKDKPPSI